MAALSSIALGASILGGGVSSFISQRKQAKGAERAGAYEAKIYGMNADLMEHQAEDAIARGAEAEQRHRLEVRGLIGAQRAAMAAQGIDVNEGTSLDIQAETAEFGEIDSLTIRNNAAREAWGYRVEAANLRNQGKLARMGASNAAASLRAGSWSTLLGSAAQAFDMGMSEGWFKRSRPGYRRQRGNQTQAGY